MSRHTRNPFSSISRFFKKDSDSSPPTSSASNANAAPAGPAPALRQISTPLNADAPFVGSPPAPQPPQPPTLLPSRQSNPPTPPRIPSQASSPPQPSIPSISQSSAPVISSYTSLPLLPTSIEHGMPPSCLTVSSQSHDSPPGLPPDPLLPPPTSDPMRHLPQPQTSRAPTPQLGGATYFPGAHGFNISNPQFNDFSQHNDYSLAGSGLKDLLKHSMPDAFHNSAARYPPPKCHLGTREEYITKITDWASGNSDLNEPILWMRGPFGIGKSAVAQSCAEVLQLQNKLAATLFFSRSNADRDDPRRVFTSIAYQIATLCEPFSNIVDARIRKDPAIAMKSLPTQFEELLVRPLAQVGIARSGMNGWVIIIDGLDECRGSSEQCEIIRVIATSARDRTTPFRWFITSRPEDPIIRTMNSPIVLPISIHLELPVSRKIDREILLYLTDEFRKIRDSHGLEESWPPEEVLSLLVERAAGLWIYVTTIVRFITNEDSYGPEYQLQLVLQFTKDVSMRVGVDNPFAEMDFLYTLIIRRVPERIRKTVLDLLLIRCVTSSWDDKYVFATLGLSEQQIRRLCASIQSVMKLRGSSLNSMKLHFYHASFLDFMKDPMRSKDLCIYGGFLVEYRRERLDWLHQVCSHSIDPSNITFPSEPVLLQGFNRDTYYSLNLKYLLLLCGVPDHPLDLPTALSLEKLPFQMMLRLIRDRRAIDSQQAYHIRDNLPIELRDKIIRKDRCPIPGCTNTEDVWIFGRGENETVTEGHFGGGFQLVNNQDPRPGRCFCGPLTQR